MRIWEVQFQIYEVMKNFPFPRELVKEIQKSPAYRIDELSRTEMQGGQLSLTLHGEGRFYDGEENKEYILPPGTAFLARHGGKDVSYYYPENGQEPWVTLWLSLYGKMSENIIDELTEKYGHIYQLPTKSGIAKRLLAYENYGNTVQPLTSGAGAKMVMDLFASLTEPDERTVLNDPQNDVIRQTRQFMIESGAVNYGVSNIAAALGLSREHLSRLFVERMGVTLGEFIRADKIRRACRLLRETRLSCRQVGEKVGYSNTASFGRVFKAAIGMTPGNFRKIAYLPSPSLPMREKWKATKAHQSVSIRNKKLN